MSDESSSKIIGIDGLIKASSDKKRRVSVDESATTGGIISSQSKSRSTSMDHGMRSTKKSKSPGSKAPLGGKGR